MILSLEKQVCSLELSKRLKELGVAQESAFYWYCPSGDMTRISLERERKINFTYPEGVISAFTVAELGIILGRYVNSVSWHSHGWREWIDIGKETYHKTEADARASRLIYLVENGIVKP